MVANPTPEVHFSSKQKETQAAVCRTGSPGVGLARVTRSPGPPAVWHPRASFGDSRPHFPWTLGCFLPSWLSISKLREMAQDLIPLTALLSATQLLASPQHSSPIFGENIFLFCKEVAGVENGRTLGNPGRLYCFESNSHLT